MADPSKFKSLSVPREDWEKLGVLATKTNRTRSKMIGRLIRFFLETTFVWNDKSEAPYPIEFTDEAIDNVGKEKKDGRSK